MTNTIASVRPAVRTGSRYFYFQMALVCVAVAFLGFLPTYWVPMAQGTASFDPVVHLHGMIFFSWTIFFAFQSWIAATGQVARHRLVGLIGVSLATTMVIFGVLVGIHLMHRMAASGQPEIGIQFAIVPFTDILCFAMLVVAAFSKITQSEWHKRLMLLAGISILGAPVFRWVVALAHAEHPTIAMALEAQMVVILICLVPILRDWRLFGRIHPAYVWGIANIVFSRVAQGTLGQTDAWHGIARWVASLG